MSRRPVLISTEAHADLQGILAYISRDSPSRGEKIVRLLRTRCAGLGRFPFSGRQRWDIEPELRSITYKGFVILYEVLDDHVGIVRVAHGARNLPAMFRSPPSAD